MCLTKQLLKQQEKSQSKPQVKINHEDQVDDLKMKKKRTRRGGKSARHSMHIQDAKMISKNKIQEKMNKFAHIKCHCCATLGHLASGCPNKLEKKAQQTMRSKAMRSIK